jgi:hypothetical protein
MNPTVPQRVIDEATEAGPRRSLPHPRRHACLQGLEAHEALDVAAELRAVLGRRAYGCIRVESARRMAAPIGPLDLTMRLYSPIAQ